MEKIRSVNVTLKLDPRANEALSVAALKLRTTRSAVLDALIEIECGLPSDSPLVEWFKSRGAKGTGTDYGTITPAEAAAKRPRGSHLKNIRKPKKDTFIRPGAEWPDHKPKENPPASADRDSFSAGRRKVS